MSYLRSLKPDAGLLQIFQAFPEVARLSPGKVAAADVDTVFAAGWDDRAIHNATAICGLFNLMNRLVNGLGVEASEDYSQMAAQRLAQGGYQQLVDLLRT